MKNFVFKVLKWYLVLTVMTLWAIGSVIIGNAIYDIAYSESVKNLRQQIILEQQFQDEINKYNSTHLNDV